MRPFLNHKRFRLVGGAIVCKPDYHFIIIIRMNNEIDHIFMRIYLIILAIYAMLKEGMNMYRNENTSNEK